MMCFFLRVLPSIHPPYAELHQADPYFLTFRACLTRFSITPSKASLSPIFSSAFLLQYSRTSFAVPSIASTLATWFFSSASVIPSSASPVVMHTCFAATRSNSGLPGDAFLDFDGEPALLLLPPAASPAPAPFLLGRERPCESTDVLDTFVPSRRIRESEPRPSTEEAREEPAGFRDGRTSFFCLEAGRISSRSTGTPSETRKRRRMRERIQSGGWRGGGATSWDQREALRGVRKIELSLGRGGGTGWSGSVGGKSAFR